MDVSFLKNRRLTNLGVVRIEVLREVSEHCSLTSRFLANRGFKGSERALLAHFPCLIDFLLDSCYALCMHYDQLFSKHYKRGALICNYGRFDAEPFMHNSGGRYMKWEPKFVFTADIAAIALVRWLKRSVRIDDATLGRVDRLRDRVEWVVWRQDEIKRLQTQLLETAVEHPRYPLIQAWAAVGDLDARNVRMRLKAESKPYHAEDWAEDREAAVAQWRTEAANHPPLASIFTEELFF